MLTGQLWKVAAVGLLLALIGAGAGWFMAAHDRDAALTSLATEQAKNAKLAAAIELQNAAVAALADQKAAAEARGAQAAALAAANGRRFDSALAAAQGAHATTCADAIPVVDAILKEIK
jgi:hypothetical protein